MTKTDSTTETLQLKHQLPCNGIQILAATYDTRRHHVLTYDSCKERPYMLRIFSLRREIRFANLFELIHHANRTENTKPFKQPDKIQMTSLAIQYSQLNDVYICVYTISSNTPQAEPFNYEYNILFLDPLTLTVLVAYPGHHDQCLQSFCYDDHSGKLVICSKFKTNPSGNRKLEKSVSLRRVSGGNALSYLDLIRVSKRQYQSQSDDPNDKSRIMLCIKRLYGLDPFIDLLPGLCGTKDMKRLFGYGIVNEKGGEPGSFIVEWKNILNPAKGIEMLQVTRCVVHPDIITCLQVSNCEKWLFTGHENGFIKAWNVHTSPPSHVNVYTLGTGPVQLLTTKHINSVLSIQLSQNGVKKNDSDRDTSHPDVADEIFFFTTEENSTIVKQWRLTAIYTDRLNTTRQNTTRMTGRSNGGDLSSRISTSRTSITSRISSLTNSHRDLLAELDEEITVYLDCLGKYDGKTGITQIKKSYKKKKRGLFPVNTLCLSVCVDMGSFNENLLLVLRDDVIHVLKVQCVVDVLLSLRQENNVFSICKSQNTNRLLSLTSENGSTVRYVSLDPVFQDDENDTENFTQKVREQYGLVPTLSAQKAAKVTTMEHFCLSDNTQQEVIVLGWSNGTVEIYSFPDSRRLCVLQDPQLNDQISSVHLVETNLLNKQQIEEEYAGFSRRLNSMKLEGLGSIPTISPPTLEQLSGPSTGFTSHTGVKSNESDGVVSRSRAGAKRNVPFGGHFFKVVSKLPLDPICSTLGKSISAPDLFHPVDTELDTENDQIEKIPVMVIVGSTEGSLLAWKLELLCSSKKPITVLEANIHIKSVHSTHIVQFDRFRASKTDLLMSLSADGMLKIWQLPTLGRMGHLNTATGDHMSMLSCMTLLTSKILAAGYEDGKLAIWKIENLDTPEDTCFRELTVSASHERRVSAIVSCTTDPDGLESEFLTSSFDMNVILWSVHATKGVEEKRYFEVGGAILDLVIDGNYAIAALPHQIRRFVFRAEETLDHKRVLKVLAQRRKTNVYVHRSAVVGDDEPMYGDDISVDGEDQSKEEKQKSSTSINPTHNQPSVDQPLSIDIPKSKEFSTSMLDSTAIVRPEVGGAQQMSSARLLMATPRTPAIQPPMSNGSGWGPDEANSLSSVDNDVLLAFLYQYIDNTEENGTIQVEQLANFMELYMRHLPSPGTLLKEHLLQNKIPLRSRFNTKDALNVLMSLQVSMDNSEQEEATSASPTSTDFDCEETDVLPNQTPVKDNEKYNAHEEENDNSGGTQVRIGMMTREEDRQKRREMVQRRRQEEKERSQSGFTASNATSKAVVTYNILGERQVKWVPVPAGMPTKQETIKSNGSIHVTIRSCTEEGYTDKEQLITSEALAQRRENRRHRISMIDSMKSIPIEYPSPDLLEIIQIPRGLQEFWTEGYCWCGSNGSPLLSVVWLAAGRKEKRKKICQMCKKQKHMVVLDREQYTCSFPIRSVLSIINDVYDSLLATCHAFLYKRWNKQSSKRQVSIYDALIKIFKKRYGMQEVVEEKIKLFFVSLSHFLLDFDSVAVFAELLEVFRLDLNSAQLPEALVALCLSTYAWFYSRETVINGSLVAAGLSIPADVNQGRTSCFQFVTLQNALLCAQEMLQYPLVSPSFLQNILAFMKDYTQLSPTKPALLGSEDPDQYQEKNPILYMELYRFMRILIGEFKEQAAEMMQLEKFLFLDAAPHVQENIVKQLQRQSSRQINGEVQLTEEEAAKYAAIASTMASSTLEKLRLILTCFILFDHCRTGTVEQQDFMELFQKLRYLWPNENLTKEQALTQDKTNTSLTFETAMLAACRRYADFAHDGQVCYLDFWALLYLVGLKSGTLVKFREIPSFCQDFKLDMTEEMREVLITYMQRVSVLLLPKGFDISTSSFDEDALLQHHRRVGGLHDGAFAIHKSQQLSCLSKRLVEEYAEQHGRSIRGPIQHDKGYEIVVNGMVPPIIQSLSTKATERFQDISYHEEDGKNHGSNDTPAIDFSQGPVVVAQRHYGPTKKEPATLRMSDGTLEQNKQAETLLPETRSMMVLDPKTLHAPVVPSVSKDHFAGQNETADYSKVYIQFPHVDPHHLRLSLSGVVRRPVMLRKFGEYEVELTKHHQYTSSHSAYQENYHDLLMSLQDKEMDPTSTACKASASPLNQLDPASPASSSSTSSPLRLGVHKSKQRVKLQRHAHVKAKSEVVVIPKVAPQSSPLAVDTDKESHMKPRKHEEAQRDMDEEWKSKMGNILSAPENVPPGSCEVNSWETPADSYNNEINLLDKTTRQDEQNDDSLEEDDTRPSTSQTENYQNNDSSQTSTAKSKSGKRGSIDNEEGDDEGDEERDEDDEEEDEEEEEVNENDAMEEDAKEMGDEEDDEETQNEENEEEVEQDLNDEKEKPKVNTSPYMDDLNHKKDVDEKQLNSFSVIEGDCKTTQLPTEKAIEKSGNHSTTPSSNGADYNAAESKHELAELTDKPGEEKEEIDHPDNHQSNEAIREEGIAANTMLQETFSEPKPAYHLVMISQKESQVPRGLRFSQQLDFGPTAALVNPLRTKGWTPLDASSDEDEGDMETGNEYNGQKDRTASPTVAQGEDATSNHVRALGMTALAFHRPKRGVLMIGRLDEEAERALYGRGKPVHPLGEGIVFSEQMEKDMNEKWQKFFNEAEDKMFSPIKQKIDAVTNRIKEEELPNKLLKRAMQNAQSPTSRMKATKGKDESDEEKDLESLSSSPNEEKMNFRMRRITRETSLAEQIQLAFGETVEGSFTGTYPTVQHYHFEYIPELHGSILTLKLHVGKGNAEVFMSTQTKVPCVSDFMWRSIESNLGKAFGEGQKIVLYQQELGRLQSLQEEEDQEKAGKINKNDAADDDEDCEGEDDEYDTNNLKKKKRKTAIVFYVTVSALAPDTKFTLGIMSSGHKREVSQAIRTVDELLERFDAFARAVENSKHRPMENSEGRMQEEQGTSSNTQRFSASQNHNQKLSRHDEPQINEKSDEVNINARGTRESPVKLDDEDEEESQAFRQLLESISRNKGFKERQKYFRLTGASKDLHEFLEDEEKKLENVQAKIQLAIQEQQNKVPLSAMELAVQKRLLQKLSPLKGKTPSTGLADTVSNNVVLEGKAKPSGIPLGLRLSKRTPLPIAYSLSTSPKQHKR